MSQKTRYEIDAAGNLFIEGVPAKDFKGKPAELPGASTQPPAPRRSPLAGLSFSLRRSPRPEAPGAIDAG
jgi:hypothetical protein